MTDPVIVSRQSGCNPSMTLDVSAAAVIDELSVGVILTASTGEIMMVNRSMRAIAEQGDGLHLRAEGLSLHRPEEEAELQRLHDLWRKRTANTGQAFLTVTRPSGRRPYIVVLQPLGAINERQEQKATFLLTWVCDPTRHGASNFDLQRRVLGLTNAEAKLAVALIRSGTLSGAANECRITVGSARQYLKRMFLKTNTAGQVDLVALLLSCEPF